MFWFTLNVASAISVRLFDVARDVAGMIKIFISHVDADKELALALANELENLGYVTWYYERDSLPGITYLQSTRDAIIRCEVFLILVTYQSLASRQVQVELMRAHERSKNIIPVLYGISDAEYKRKNEVWEQIIGASTSCSVTHETVGNVAGRIALGLAQSNSGTEEQPLPDHQESFQPSMPQRVQGVLATRQAKFFAAVEEGDQLYYSKDWDAAEAAYRRALTVPGFSDHVDAVDGIKAAQAGRKEEMRVATEKRLAEENRLAEERRQAEEKRLAEEKRVEEEKRVAEEIGRAHV